MLLFELMNHFSPGVVEGGGGVGVRSGGEGKGEGVGANKYRVERVSPLQIPPFLCPAHSSPLPTQHTHTRVHTPLLPSYTPPPPALDERPGSFLYL